MAISSKVSSLSTFWASRMEIWDLINPILRVVFYFTAFGTAGTTLFILHFRKHAHPELLYQCKNLIHKSALGGILISLILFLSVAGNIGGDLASIFEYPMLQIAFFSKAGIAAITSLLGFTIIFIAGNWRSKWRTGVSITGSCIILLSFVIVGHSYREGLLTQFLLLVHLIGIAYWLGSLLPLSKLCRIPDIGNLPLIAHGFGIFAIGYVSALVFAGCIFAYKIMGGVTPLIDTTYGNTLLIKIIVVTLLLSIAALNKFLMVPLLSQNLYRGARRLRFFVNLEMVLASLALLLTSLLTTSLDLPLGYNQ